MKSDNLHKAQISFFKQFEITEGGCNNREYNDLEMLVQKVQTKTMRIADVGCYSGYTTILFGTLANQFGGHVWAIDNFKGTTHAFMIRRSHARFNVKTILTKNIIEHDLQHAVNVIEKDSVDASKLFEDNYFDLVFIDADHSYEGVKKDIQAWLPKVKSGGILCGHDCELIIRNGIQDLYDEFGQYDFVGMHLGVMRAISELLPNAQIYRSKIYDIKFPERIWWIQK